MYKHSIFAVLTSLAASAFAVSPTAIAPVVFQPVFTVQSYAFSSLAGGIEPYFDKFAQEDPERVDLMSALTSNVISASLTTVNSPTYFQTTLGTLPVTLTKNIAGLGRGFNANWTNQGLLPPDTTMAVGPNQIVQWVNLRLSVMDKNGTPLVGGALGYINGNAIWSALPAGSICKISNQGDPLVAYDRLADRWILSQFAFTTATATASPFRTYPAVGSYRQCVAVSTTGDATGTYTLYEYAFTKFPDYGKVGVWPDAYYLTFNNFTFSTTTGLSSYAGASSCAFDRSRMLAANPVATSVCFNFANSDPFFSMLPADLDGSTPPPAGSPNYQISPDWFFLNNPPYSIQLQKFHVDFTTPANSTLSDGIGGANGSFIKMPMPSLIGSCGDGGGNCVPQPGTVRVFDTSSMRAMYPLKYRNRGGVESLVFTQSIDPPAPSTAVAGMSFIEIRSPGANPPVMRQNGALAPADAINRWMGSATMDKQGNIAMGYSASSSTLSPSIRIAGRLNADIVSRLRGEMQVVAGSGAQTSTAQRWGDYSTMQIDPVDDCTFWYTTEYTTTTSAADWATRIIAFKFNSCN